MTTTPPVARAEWRCSSDTALRDKVLHRSDLPKAPKIDGQLALDLSAAGWRVDG